MSIPLTQIYSDPNSPMIPIHQFTQVDEWMQGGKASQMKDTHE